MGKIWVGEWEKEDGCEISGKELRKLVLPAGLEGECGEGEMHEPAEGRAHVAVLSPRLRQEGIIYRLQFDTGSQSFLNSFKGDVFSHFSFPMDSSKEQKKRKKKKKANLNPRKLSMCHFCALSFVSLFFTHPLPPGTLWGESQVARWHLSSQWKAPSSVGGDQCKHLPGGMWGVFLSLSGSMRILFVCFSAETTL